jgi:hypothetical protein
MDQLVEQVSIHSQYFSPHATGLPKPENPFPSSCDLLQMSSYQERTNGAVTLNASSEELRQPMAPFRARDADAEPAGKHLATIGPSLTGLFESSISLH